MAPWFALLEVRQERGAESNIKLTDRTGVGSRSSTSRTLQETTLHTTDLHSQLIRSPTFNRGIQKVYKKINRIPDHEPKNGLGRTSTSVVATGWPLTRTGTGPSAFDHFKDEVKTQFKELTWQKRHPRK